MAGSFTNTFEAMVLDYYFGNASSGASRYIALYTVTPGETGGGTEVTGGNYSRVTFTNNATNWPAATPGNPTTKANGAAITFPTANASWGTVNGFAIFDNNNTTMLVFGDLNTPKAVGSGDTISFAISDLTITLD